MNKEKIVSNLKPGDLVTLIDAPKSLLEGLPLEDQQAILAFVGKQIFFIEINEKGLLELEFTDDSGVIHSIWVEPSCVKINN